MSTKKKLTRWYISPSNKTVNDMIASALEGSSFAFSSDIAVILFSGETKELPLWEVPYHVITALKQERRAKNKFIVFSQEKNGDIREFCPEKWRKFLSGGKGEVVYVGHI